MGAIIDFLIGKSPKIFDKDGSVRHELGDDKWKKWDSRYQNNPEFNWRQHVGTKAGAAQNTQTAPGTKSQK